ncbi:MAG: acyl-CoA dehydrogenase family protein [Thermodesulfobacteriota bacterium]
MDFSWDEDQLELKKTVIDFAQKELNSDLIERDRTGSFPGENWKKCADFGIHRLAIPIEFGGCGFDPLTTMFAMEGLGYGCKDNGLIFAINAQMWSIQSPILRFGSEIQKRTYLPKLLSGELIGSHGMTEPGSGSDSFSLLTRADKKGDTYILNGTKTFISNAVVADLFLIFATVNKSKGFMGITAFLIEKGINGLSVGRSIEKMGLRTSPMAEVVLDDCKVGTENRLGKEGNGAIIFKHSMGWERSCILASCIGTMERQVEVCTEYAKTREQFGKPIGKFQSIANRIIDMKIRLETARLLLYRAGWLRSQGQKAIQEVAMAKLYLSECFVQSSLDAIQVHGGYGFTTEYGIERELRDSVAGRIYSGTSEIQREIIAQAMGL